MLHDFAAGHIVFMEWSDGFEIGFIFGIQAPLFGKAPEDIAGEQNPAFFVECAETLWNAYFSHRGLCHNTPGLYILS